jgi:hypothetical protein
MVFKFMVAVLAAHLGDKCPDVFPALAMLCGSLFLMFNWACPLHTRRNQKRVENWK